MIQVMVVDDQPLVRLAIKTLTDWENHGFLFQYEAANGRQALKLLDEHPGIGIVITDINMPVMDGLALIAAMQERGFSTKVIVLSVYNDYPLVRQAFKLGIHDYILKTDLDAGNMLRLLTGVAKQLEAGPTEPSAPYPLSSLEMPDSKNQWLKKLLNRNIHGESGTLNLDTFRLGRKNLQVCFLWVDNFQEIACRYHNLDLQPFMETVIHAVEQVLAGNDTGEATAISPQEYVVVISSENSSYLRIRAELLDILSQIRHALTNYLNISISVGVSSMKDGLETLPELFKEAEANARLRFFFGKGRIIFPEETQVSSESVGFGMVHHETGLMNAMSEADPEKMSAGLKRLLDYINTLQFTKIEKIYPYYMEIMLTLARFLNEREESLETVLGEPVDFYGKITGFETRDEANQWIRNMAGSVFHYLLEKKDVNAAKSSANRVIIRAREFIQANYHRDLTLKMVGDYVGLSESRLSNLFTHQTGENFVNYLTRVRIEKAKELLVNSNLKIYEIALQVGFQSIEHFSRVFKKVTGMSPNQYK